MCERRCGCVDEVAEREQAEWRARHKKTVDAAALTLIAASAIGAIGLAAHGVPGWALWIGMTAAADTFVLATLPGRTAWPMTFGTLLPAWCATTITLSITT